MHVLLELSHILLGCTCPLTFPTAPTLLSTLSTVCHLPWQWYECNRFPRYDLVNGSRAFIA